MSQPTKQRPPQVSLASGIVMFSSVVVLLTAWERVTSLRSLETQDAIRDVLADAPFSSLGLDRVEHDRAAAGLVHGRRGLRVRDRDPRLVRPQARPLLAPGA